MQNDKTIKQIADEIGVSKQAVQKRISREPLYTNLQPFVYTLKGIKYIAESGVLLVLSAFGIDTPTTLSIDASIDKTDDVYTLSIDKSENVYSDVYSKIDDDIIKLLQDNITILQKQLDTKDKQIDDLNNRLEEVMAALTQEQALHAGTIQKQLTDGSTEKTSFFKRIFNHNKKD